MWQDIDLRGDGDFERTNALAFGGKVRECRRYWNTCSVSRCGLCRAGAGRFYFRRYNRRVAAERLNNLEPVFDAVFFLRQTRVEYQQVETALGEKELMRCVHNFLPAEVPDIQLDFGLLIFDFRLTISGKR